MFIQAAPERIKVGDTQIDMLRRGSGPKLLYLHAGDGVDASDEFISLLSQRFEVIAPSHPGFANSDLPAGFRSVGDLAYFYLDLIEKLDLGQFTLVGSSFGGWIATELAVRNAHNISALVLAAPMGVSIDEPGAPAIPDLFSVAIADLPGTFFSNKEIGLKAFGGLKFADMPEDAVVRFARNRETLALFGWSPIFSNPSLAQWLHRIPVKTLLLSGDDDKVLPAALKKLYTSRIPNIQEQIIKGAGHYLHIERPTEFANAISDFAASASNDKRGGRLQ